MNKFTFYKTMMMVALLFATTVLSHAAVGDKWKEGKLYYKVTAEGTPNTVEVVPQNDGSPYWDDAEKPTGDLTIPATVTHVGITYDVTSIGRLAFSRCSGLTSVTCLVGNPANITLGGYGVFYYVPFGTVTLYVPAGSVGNYQAADQWKKFTNIQEITSATGVILSAKAKTLEVGQEFTLTATVQPDNATNKDVTWKSSDAAVATVDANGKVKALKAGEAIITVTTVDGSKTATCKVTVGGVSVVSIALNETSKTLNPT